MLRIWPGRHQRPCAPESRRGGQKADIAAQRDHREARRFRFAKRRLGRSRGGYGTKACVITDAIGRAVAFILAPGQTHELPHAVALLDQLPDVPKWVVADRGYSSHGFLEHIWDLGARPAIPPKQNDERRRAFIRSLARTGSTPIAIRSSGCGAG